MAKRVPSSSDSIVSADLDASYEVDTRVVDGVIEMMARKSAILAHIEGMSAEAFIVRIVRVEPNTFATLAHASARHLYEKRGNGINPLFGRHVTNTIKLWVLNYQRACREDKKYRKTFAGIKERFNLEHFNIGRPSESTKTQFNAKVRDRVTVASYLLAVTSGMVHAGYDKKDRSKDEDDRSYLAHVASLEVLRALDRLQKLTLSLRVMQIDSAHRREYEIVQRLSKELEKHKNEMSDLDEQRIDEIMSERKPDERELTIQEVYQRPELHPNNQRTFHQENAVFVLLGSKESNLHDPRARLYYDQTGKVAEFVKRTQEKEERAKERIRKAHKRHPPINDDYRYNLEAEEARKIEQEAEAEAEAIIEEINESVEQSFPENKKKKKPKRKEVVKKKKSIPKEKIVNENSFSNDSDSMDNFLNQRMAAYRAKKFAIQSGSENENESKEKEEVDEINKSKESKEIEKETEKEDITEEKENIEEEEEIEKEEEIGMLDEEIEKERESGQEVRDDSEDEDEDSDDNRLLIDTNSKNDSSPQSIIRDGSFDEVDQAGFNRTLSDLEKTLSDPPQQDEAAASSDSIRSMMTNSVRVDNPELEKIKEVTEALQSVSVDESALSSPPPKRRRANSSEDQREATPSPFCFEEGTPTHSQDAGYQAARDPRYDNVVKGSPWKSLLFNFPPLTPRTAAKEKEERKAFLKQQKEKQGEAEALYQVERRQTGAIPKKRPGPKSKTAVKKLEFDEFDEKSSLASLKVSSSASSSKLPVRKWHPRATQLQFEKQVKVVLEKIDASKYEKSAEEIIIDDIEDQKEEIVIDDIESQEEEIIIDEEQSFVNNDTSIYKRSYKEALIEAKPRGIHQRSYAPSSSAVTSFASTMTSSDNSDASMNNNPASSGTDPQCYIIEEEYGLAKYDYKIKKGRGRGQPPREKKSYDY